MDISPHPERPDAEYSLALIFPDVKVLQPRSVRPEQRAQIGDRIDLMQVNRKLVRVEIHGLAAQICQSRVAQGKYLFPFPENQVIAQPVLIGDEDASHDG